MTSVIKHPIYAVIGLGNPGSQYNSTRHNIGFAILDAYADQVGASWNKKETMLIAEVRKNDQTILLIKPQTFMNASGKVLPALLKKGIKAENILVVHDELELPFGKIKERFGGSARGHNGLRSIIEYIGKDFYRLSFGIDRPATQTVSDYVLAPFTEDSALYEQAVQNAVDLLAQIIGQ